MEIMYKSWRSHICAAQTFLAAGVEDPVVPFSLSTQLGLLLGLGQLQGLPGACGLRLSIVASLILYAVIAHKATNFDFV